jgi:hypothetical protein
MWGVKDPDGCHLILRFLHTAHANDPMQGWSGIGVGGRAGWRGAGGNMLLGDENREKKRERESVGPTIK